MATVDKICMLEEALTLRDSLVYILPHPNLKEKFRFMVWINLSISKCSQISQLISGTPGLSSIML